MKKVFVAMLMLISVAKASAHDDAIPGCENSLSTICIEEQEMLQEKKQREICYQQHAYAHITQEIKERKFFYTNKLLQFVSEKCGGEPSMQNDGVRKGLEEALH